LKHIEVGAVVKEKGLHDGWDDTHSCYIFNEDKVCDELEEIMVNGNTVVDFHSCDFFPERWFHLVVVLRTNNSMLYPRLEKRGYDVNKIQENVECEIMQVVLDEARDSYKEELIWELQSDTVEDMESNVEKIIAWVNHKLPTN